MKKWLIGCLMALAMVCLMGMTANAETEIICTTCFYCNQRVNHEILRYERYNVDQHYVIFICSNCGKENKMVVVGSEFDKHTGGTETPTCTTGKHCSKCGAEYGKLGHQWSDAWTSSGDGTHTRPCTRAGCNAVDTANCGGDGDATCVKPGTCTTCGAQYYGGHTFPARWKWDSETEVGRDAEKHWVRCLNCTEGKTHENAHSFAPGNVHLKSEATCVSKAVYYVNCATCFYKRTDTYEYGDIDPNKHDIAQYEAKAPTCTETGWAAYEACRYGCGYTTKVEIPASNHDVVHHDAKAPTCTELGWDAYDTCKNCDYTTYAEIPASGHVLAHHDAKAPTCTEIGWNAYDTCKNCDYTTYAEIPALGHDYQKTIVEPTCEKDGYTQYACSRGDDVYTENPVKRLYHWFGEWTPNADGSNSANCLRKGCKHTGKTDCQKFEFQVEENASLTFCPVCGLAENGRRLEQIEKARASAVTGKLPTGGLIARTNGEYLSVAFELAGKLTQPTGQLKITLPAEALEGRSLTLIALDGTQTALPFEMKDDEASFTLDFTEAAIPVMLIRLIPEA